MRCLIFATGISVFWVVSSPMIGFTQEPQSRHSIAQPPARSILVSEGFTQSHQNAVTSASTLPQTNQTHATPNRVSPYRFPTQSYFSKRRPFLSRLIDGKLTYRHRDPAEVDSRYIGGFHQSHFEGLGLPSGDLGIRGNALHWRTW